MSVRGVGLFRPPLPCPRCGARNHPKAEPKKLPGNWITCRACGFECDELTWWPDD